MDDVGKWLQRDVNCLKDPQRSVRKRSLEKLSHVSDLVRKFGQDALVCFMQSHMFQPLVECIADPIEKCRELSILTCKEYAKVGAMQGDGREKALIIAIHARIGKSPFVETSEELRLMLLELLQLVLQASDIATLENCIGDVMEVLAKTAADPFPDAKRVCCDTVLVVAQKWPIQVKMHLATLVKPLTLNLGHQHAKVRQCTLQALEAIVPCGSTTLPELMKDILLPNLSRVVFDRSAAVRKQLVQTIATWYARITELREFEASLLPLQLSGLTDDSLEVQEFTMQKLNELCLIWAADELNKVNDSSEDEAMSVIVPLASVPFQSRPPKGARLQCQRLLAKVIPSLLEQCSDWTVQTREKSTSILRIVLLLAEDNVNLHVPAILTAMAKTCRDDEAVVVNSVTACMGIVGQFADPELLFATLLPLAAGRLAGQDTSHHRTNGLVLLSMSIAGMPQTKILPHMDRITEALADNGLREADVPELQEKLALVTTTIVSTGYPLLSSHDVWSFRLFWILSQVMAATPEDSVAFETAAQGLEYLAQAHNVVLEGLYIKCLPLLLQSIQPANWTKATPNRILFDSVARRGGRACANNMHAIVPILITHLDPSKEPDVRLAFLALLETMLGNTLMYKAFEPFASKLLINGITPNIVWQAGKVAATIRKVAMACMYTLLRQGLATRACLFEAAPHMLPVLKAALDDTDAKTRQLVCLAFQFLFVALPDALGGMTNYNITVNVAVIVEPVSQLYHELLKRLDDSNDLVRKAACATYVMFLRAAPPSHFQGTIIDYTMDALFVHLDDTDSEIQAAVFEVLKETKRIDAIRLASKARDNRNRMRNPMYIDQLLQ
ncbi:hypothetical protein THRCLA_03322 [Thraustotheca clavata]|uniref:TOG domain-containing protein n=1 Tax=Thraustotheca clavata TaxID=74557 RepID=A0A1W0A2N6_9STRA|nr:hypothetical protein THRCLA_03322 [Thraustotheca clavata]